MNEKAALDHMQTMYELNGISSVTVSDGTVFRISAKVLQALLDKANTREDKQVIVFVKHSTHRTRS